MSQPNSYILLGVLLDHAPTGKEQAFMSAKYNEVAQQILADNGDYEKDLEKAMASMLNSGLQYGNWPWTVAGIVEKAKPGTFGPWGPAGRQGN